MYDLFGERATTHPPFVILWTHLSTADNGHYRTQETFLSVLSLSNVLTRVRSVLFLESPRRNYTIVILGRAYATIIHSALNSLLVELFSRATDSMSVLNINLFNQMY